MGGTEKGVEIIDYLASFHRIFGGGGSTQVGGGRDLMRL